MPSEAAASGRFSFARRISDWYLQDSWQSLWQFNWGLWDITRLDETGVNDGG